MAPSAISPKDETNDFVDVDESMYIVDDLTAICNSLGKIDQNDGTYMKDRDCKPSLKEIMRMLSKDHNRHHVRVALGALNIVKSDLIPLTVQYCSLDEGDQDLFAIILRLFNNLTSSVLMLFENNKIPTDLESQQLHRKLLSYLARYKEAFAEDEIFWKIINDYLRYGIEDDDEVTFERLLILIRNILHIPVDNSHHRGYNTFDAHDMCLQQISNCGMLGTFIKIATSSPRGSEFCLHLSEIIYLMLRDQNPETIANAKESKFRNKADEADHTRKRYLELSAREKCQREAFKRQNSSRLNRFRSMFVVQNCRSLSNNPLIVSKPVTNREMLSFDKWKPDIRKAKNKRPLSSESYMSNSDNNMMASKVGWSLKVFCVKFVEDVYRNYMHQMKHSLILKKAVENDESYYLWALQFFIAFSQHMRLNNEYISETVSSSTLHYVMMLINRYQELLKAEKKTYQDISKRLHMAVRTFKEMLKYIKAIENSTLKRMLVEETEYKLLVLNLFGQYEESKHSDYYLKDLIFANQVFLEVIESYDKDYDPTTFVSRYCNPDVMKAHLKILSNFKNNDESINLAIVKLLDRIVYDCKSELILCQASVMLTMLAIIEYKSILNPAPPSLNKLATIGIHIIKSFGSMANKQRFMFQELLFWKSFDDMREIDSVINPPDPMVVGSDNVIDSTQKLRAELEAFEYIPETDSESDNESDFDLILANEIDNLIGKEVKKVLERTIDRIIEAEAIAETRNEARIEIDSESDF